MAYNFTATSSQFLTTSAAPLTGPPLTIAAWFNCKSNTAQGHITAIDRGIQSGAGFHSLVLPSNVNVVNAISNDGTFSTTSTTTTYTLNTWNHGCAVFASNSSRTVYLNGGGSATNTTTRNVTNLANVTIGARYSNFTPQQFINCLIAEVGIWNVVLTESEIISLAKGITPDKIRPQNLAFYAPLIRDLQDTKGGLSITNNNGATVANHPRIYS
jgi:hypothetical protein